MTDPLNWMMLPQILNYNNFSYFMNLFQLTWVIWGYITTPIDDDFSWTVFDQFTAIFVYSDFSDQLSLINMIYVLLIFVTLFQSLIRYFFQKFLFYWNSLSHFHDRPFSATFKVEKEGPLNALRFVHFSFVVSYISLFLYYLVRAALWLVEVITPYFSTWTGLRHATYILRVVLVVLECRVWFLYTLFHIFIIYFDLI